MSDIAQTPEAIARLLMHEIRSIEGGGTSRQQLLDLYAECLDAVRGNRMFAMENVQIRTGV